MLDIAFKLVAGKEVQPHVDTGEMAKAKNFREGIWIDNSRNKRPQNNIENSKIDNFVANCRLHTNLWQIFALLCESLQFFL